MLWYLEFSFVIEKEQFQMIEAALEESLNPISISVEDFDANGIDEQAIFMEPVVAAQTGQLGESGHALWNKNRVSVLFLPSFDTSQDMLSQKILIHCLLMDILNKIFHFYKIYSPEVEHRWFSDQDWVTLTQNQFSPIAVGKRLWVSPTWHASTLPNDGRIRLWLDPGMAFGTGGHATTFLCLSWLEQANLKGKSVLDYGTGSGILAIASQQLGAESIVGVDIDTKAVEIAKFNASRNQVDTSAETWCSVDDFEQNNKNTQYDVVVANILANPLKFLAPKLVDYVKSSGILILSGVLEVQAAEVCAVYEAVGVPMRLQERLDDWVLLCSDLTIKHA